MRRAKPIHRILALLFDLAISYAIAILIMFESIVALIDAVRSQDSAAIFALFGSSLFSGGILIIFLILYFLILPLKWKGQTIGKKFFKLRIVKLDGTPVDFMTLFIREVIGRILIAAMSVGLSMIVNGTTLVLNEHRLVFHDILASTQVIDVE